MMNTWIVVDLDEGVLGSFETKQNALLFCKEYVGDMRKSPKLKKKRKDLYEYIGPYYSMRVTTLDIGTKESLMKIGYDEAIKAYENGEEYNKKNNDWNTLASPKSHFTETF